MHVLCVCCVGGGGGVKMSELITWLPGTYRIGKGRKIDVPDPLGSDTSCSPRSGAESSSNKID
jgi:hypothetical protein